MEPIIVPVYFQVTKAKKVLVGANYLRNCHFQAKNKIKKEFSKIASDQILAAKHKPIVGTYEVIYTYFYKNSATDLANVTSATSKMFNDCLQEIGIVENDNVKYCIKETHLVGGPDKLNPRVEVTYQSI